MKKINLIKHMAALVNEHEHLQAKARGLGVDAEELNIALASTLNLMAAGLTTAALQAIVDSVAAANQKSIDDYRGGKTNALGFLVGQCMKASKGKGNPALMKEMLLKILEG